MALRVPDRRDGDVPPAGLTLNGGTEGFNPADLPQTGTLDGILNQRLAFGGPKRPPLPTFDGGEVINLHRALPVHIHEFERAVHVDNLDTVRTGIEDGDEGGRGEILQNIYGELVPFMIIANIEGNRSHVVQTLYLIYPSAQKYRLKVRSKLSHSIKFRRFRTFLQRLCLTPEFSDNFHAASKM